MYVIVTCVTIVISSIILLTNAQKCPELYKRYSKDHTYCKAANSSCQIITSGITNSDVATILAEHNKYRSRIANGKESIGQLPPAKDMLFMEWDDELQAVAQKHADQCLFDHDCNQCRRVFNFGVGQNLYTKWGSGSPSKEWSNAVKSWYDEVKDFKKPIIDSFGSIQVKAMIGHFTQVIWARSWKIGCGYSAFKTSEGYQELYTCNYGEGGNMRGAKIYDKGSTCSACPLNAVCEKGKTPGLCKMKDSNKAPEYKPSFPDGKKLFFCDFSDKNECPVSVTSNQWKIMDSLSGAFASIVLKGGESSTMTIEHNIKSPKDTCIGIRYRGGPNVAGQQSTGKAEEQLINVASGSPTPIPLRLNGDFTKFQMKLGWGGTEYKVGFKFTVPSGSPDQYFEITDILVMEGSKC